jgi:hypothetical protein
MQPSTKENCAILIISCTSAGFCVLCTVQEWNMGQFFRERSGTLHPPSNKAGKMFAGEGVRGTAW